MPWSCVPLNCLIQYFPGPVTIWIGRGWPCVTGHFSGMPEITNACGLHASSLLLARAATSGRPVALPVLSAQPVAGDWSGLNSALPPTRASAFLHASMRPFFDSSALSLESQVLATILRQARPPWSLVYLAN